MWWGRFPAGAARFSPGLGASLRDGLYLSAWPAAGALLPLLALIVGLYLGYERAGYDPGDGIHFLYSFEIVIVFVLVSQLGAALGFWMWLGFALGEFYLYMPQIPSSGALGFVGSRLLNFAVAWTLLVALPLAQSRLTQALAANAGALARSAGGSEAGARAMLAILARAVLGYGMVYFWTLTAAVLMQAVFSWSGYTPMTHGMVQRWITQSYILALIAAYAGAMRSALVMAAQPGIAARLRAAPPPAPAWSAYGAIVLRALFATLLMGTFLATWTDAIELFGIFIIIQGARLMLAPALAVIQKVPLAVRVLAAFVVVYIAVHVLISSTADTATTFWPAEASAIIGMAVFALAFPARRNGP